MMIKVSVIIPVYNCSVYLSQCIDSVLGQSLTDIEVICINDGSQDGSGDILASYAERDARMIILNQSNRGAAASRNRGIMQATGQYVFFLDADDWLPEDVLEELYVSASQQGLKACGGSLHRYKDGREYVDDQRTHEGYVFRTKGVMNYRDYQFELGFQRFLYHREMLWKNNITFPAYRNYEDPVFMVKALYCAEEFGFTDTCVYMYRDTCNSSSKVVSLETITDMIRGMQDVLTFADYNNLQLLYNNTFCRLNSGARCEIEKTLNTGDPERKLYDLLLEINAGIRWDWLPADTDRILFPLAMVYSEYRKYERIRNSIVFKVIQRLSQMINTKE